MQKGQELKKVKGKKVTIVGLARSGAGAANLLSLMGADVTVTDIKREDELKSYIQNINKKVKLVLGSHPEYLFKEADLVVVSPGVPLDISPLSLARSNGVPVIGELELAYRITVSGLNEEERIINCNKGFLAVTGTNGKSTTTSLLDFMMNKGGFKTLLGGNIGNALTEEILKSAGVRADKKTVDFVVVEVSSFQLEAIEKFKPVVASLLNITPDHLDRYHSMKDYIDAKAKIFMNQTEEDYLVLNYDDDETRKLYYSELKSIKPQVYFFSRKHDVKGMYIKDGYIYCNIPDITGEKNPSILINADDIRIKGVHNLENAMAASAMALLAGCPVNSIIDSLKEFEGLEHRLEFVREINGVSYINDSKGTNVAAVMKSLEGFESPVILIAGGRDKAGDFTALRELVKEKVKSLILIGEASVKIKKALGDLVNTYTASSLKDAIEIAQREAKKGDVVLLSPACASFDMFRDFEDRGRQFKDIVRRLK